MNRNKIRARRATALANVFYPDGGRDALIDQMSDLLHACDAEGVDPEQVMSTARTHHAEEVRSPEIGAGIGCSDYVQDALRLARQLQGLEHASLDHSALSEYLADTARDIEEMVAGAHRAADERDGEHA